MEKIKEKELKKHICIGLLAHVDAGKTTLSEAMLYTSGKIKKMGRVDHQDAYLDYDVQERNRGITIFSKQVIFDWSDTQITLLDTPGHADFSSEMERSLQVLDCAVLVISGTDGVQTHTKTIWHLLARYHVPVILFINKLDMAGADQKHVLAQLQQELNENCLDFSVPNGQLLEELSLVSDHLLEHFVNDGTLDEEEISQAFMSRQVFPCFGGSALRMQGVEALMNGICALTREENNGDKLSARVYKISRDEQGQRLTHMKITGGLLTVKDVLENGEKIDQIRIYSGHRFTSVQQAEPGTVCAVRGPTSLEAGDVIGESLHVLEPLLSSCMDYRIVLPEGTDVHQALPLLKQLSEEDPQLNIAYHSRSQDIRIQLMGDIQIEVLRRLILDRFGLAVTFDHGQILYKETITQPVLGVGHYEPLRHYAEVQLLLEPGQPGSGIQIASRCQEDVLAKHWQNLILTHLKEKNHLGVLTGSPITDIKITLLSGRFHLKHTEGGDFRQATYRAVRQGLKMAESTLLEPYFQYHAEIPTHCLSRFIFNMDEMHGHYEIIQSDDQTTYLKGEAPAANLQHYYQDILAYTKGKGKIQYAFCGYHPCENQTRIMTEIGYDSEADLDNPTGSIFCAHGAGYYVPYDQVYEKMHIPPQWSAKATPSRMDQPLPKKVSDNTSDQDLLAIFEKTYGPVQHKTIDQFGYRKKTNETVQQADQRSWCLLVDGYNVIFSWPELKKIAELNLDVARSRLIDILCNYQGYKQCLLILVFDAYKVKDNPGLVDRYHNIYLVYTKEAQTADMFIERTTHRMAKDFQIAVVTSDGLEQIIVAGKGARRVSSREFLTEVEYTTKEKLKSFLEKQEKDHHFPLESLSSYLDQHES